MLDKKSCKGNGEFTQGKLEREKEGEEKKERMRQAEKKGLMEEKRR